MEQRSAIELIANWASSLTRAAVPDAARNVVRACVIDTVGVALAGTRTRVACLARDYACATTAGGNATVVGSEYRLAAPGAAFANAVAAHALDFDDNCDAGIVHGSAIVVPAALAVAEATGASGSDFVTAIIAGLEAEYAVGAAATRSLYDRGWWTTALLGPIGACVAASRLLALDPQATVAALGIAICGAGGIKPVFGTDGKPLLAGRAAEAGVVAACLAARGASGPRDALDADRGLAHMMNGGQFDASAFNLGSHWRLLSPGIDVKRIPLCLSSHAAVDATRELAGAHALAPSRIRRIVCDVPPIVVANLKHRHPQSAQQAQFSMHFAVAATLLFGDVGLAQLDPAVLVDARLQSLMARVEMVTGPRWDVAARSAAPEGAVVRIEFDDGSAIETCCARARGSAARPLGSAEIDAKFLMCADYARTEIEPPGLLQRLHGVEDLTRVADLLGAIPA
ncbi:MAG: MmgE/PrpD family protein [Rudaea sp.]